VSSYFDVQLFLSVFVTLLVIMNPSGAVPIFLGLTTSLTHKQREVAALRASLVALGVIAAFAVFGQQILTYLHISLAALAGAGGLLLLLVALQLLVGQESGVNSDAGGSTWRWCRWGHRSSPAPERSWRRCWQCERPTASRASWRWPLGW
jgi:multiple antibiotic resistance protein